MPDITVSCPHCGELLEAPSELVGESVECPTCQAEFEIPDPNADADPQNVMGAALGSQVELAEAPADDAASTCPHCNAAMPPDSVLCLACGFHTGMGKVIETNFS